nr:cytochrome c oxidase subunit II [Ficopomatus enigmaticus]
MAVKSGDFMGPVFNEITFLSWGLFMMFSLIMVSVMTVVLVSLFISLSNSCFRPSLLDNPELEKRWTLIPLVLVSILACPSLLLLYDQNNPILKTSFVVKITGHQWYWEYDYPTGFDMDGVVGESSSFGPGSFDSFPLAEEGLIPGEVRWSSTDKRLVIPSLEPVKLVGSSDDVIHNFNVKPLGISSDCVPGRLNQMLVYSNVSGVASGLCSELCGVGHSHMPCEVEMVVW